MTEPFVFVSHSGQDKGQLRELVLDDLVATGIPVWFDRPQDVGYTNEEIDRHFMRLHAGGEYEDEIDEALREASAVMGVWSSNVVAAFKADSRELRRTLKDELTYARTNKTLICCRIDGLSPGSYPEEFGKQHNHDVRRDAPNRTATIGLLLDDIRKKMNLAPSAALVRYRQERCADLSDTSAGKQLFTQLSLLLDHRADQNKSERLENVDEKYDELSTLLDVNSSPDADRDMRAFVLLGGPGTGKSTVLRKLDLECAGTKNTPSERFSFFVSLKRYDKASGDPFKWLCSQWDTMWRRRIRALPELSTLMRQHDTYLLLDALNEMPHRNPAEYQDLLDKWGQFVRNARQDETFSRVRLIFSCRSFDYSKGLSRVDDGGAGEEQGVPQIQIEDLTDDRIRRFLRNYAPHAADDLFTRADGASRKQVSVAGTNDAEAPSERGSQHYNGDPDELYEALQRSGRVSIYRTAFFLRLLIDHYEVFREVPEDVAALFTGAMRVKMRQVLLAAAPDIRSDSSDSSGRSDWSALGGRMIDQGLLTRQEAVRLRNQFTSNYRKWETPYWLPEGGFLFGALSLLAYQMQASKSDGESLHVEVPDLEAIKLVCGNDIERFDQKGASFPVRLTEEQARRVIEFGRDIELLVRSKENLVQFNHQLVQEYFAARRLARQPDSARSALAWETAHVKPSLQDYFKKLPDSEPMPAVAGTGWEETTLLAALMSRNSNSFIEGLLAVNRPLAGRAAAQNRTHLTPKLSGQIRASLLQRMRDATADLRHRVAAGKALGELGHPDFARSAIPNRGDVLEPPVCCLQNPVLDIGTTKAEWSHANESPRHNVRLKSFAMSVYPVTNAEWQCFMDNGGYEDEFWWQSEHSRRWRRGETTRSSRDAQWRDFRSWLQTEPHDPSTGKIGIPEQRFGAGQISRLEMENWTTTRDDSDEKFEAKLKKEGPRGRYPLEPRYWRNLFYNNPLQPVVGICWYEALAYCAWLRGVTGRNWRLPSEIEWEVAARYGQPMASERYVWGDVFPAGDANNLALRCNTFETRIGAPSPVGIFPNGQSAIGLVDMCGNSFEWTTSKYTLAYDDPKGDDDWADGDTARVLRGGSFYYRSDYARTAFRLRYHPGYHNRSSGFRLLLEL